MWTKHKQKAEGKNSDGLFNTAHNTNTGERKNEGECGEQNGEGKVKGV